MPVTEPEAVYQYGIKGGRVGKGKE